MKKALMLIAAAAALLPGAAFAGDITAEQARTVAANFVTKDAVGLSVLPDRTVDTVAQRGGFYLVTLKPSGHVLVSANRSARPIPSFSESDFVEPADGSPQAAFLAVAEMNAIRATGTTYEAQWKALLGEKVLRLTTSSATNYVNIEPMLKTAWTQNYPYNALMPVVNRSHALVGCVATAYSQILRYWEWPEVLNEDVVSEHFVGSAWGHAWRLKAGTVFGWKDMPCADGYDNATLLKFGRATMFAGMLAHMTYNTGASGAQTAQPGRNRWYTEPNVLDTSNSTLAQREEGMKQSLKNGCPFMVSVNTADGGHAVVGDGWRESSLGAYVHLNYGWGYADQSYYGTSEPLGVYLGAKPRAMVMNKPLPARSTLPVKVEWSFPTKGYDATLTGFMVAYEEVEDEIADWSDDMSVGKGTIDGGCLSVETVDETGHGNVMRIGTKADDATYTWPTMVATKDTAFSYDIHSLNALGMSVEVQLLDPSVGWVTLVTPEISANSEIAWTTHGIDLGQYAGKGIAIRVKAIRTGSTSVNDDTARLNGVQFDNVTLTNVRQVKTAVATATAGKDARCLNVSDSLVADKTYLFQVTPTFGDGTKGIPGYKASCTIVNDAVAKPTITSVASVRSGIPTVKGGMYRECYFGLNQFGVYGSESVTKMEAYLSNLSVIGEVQEEDAAVPGTFITAYKKVSIENAVSVDKKSSGNFLVKVNVSKLTDYLYGTGMILTLVARNEQGDVDQKDVFLEFTKTGSEQEIAVADLPENGGTVTPDEPDPVYYTVTFDSAGGSAVSARSCKSGDAIGPLDTPTKDGFSFAGWFSDPTNGTRIHDDEPVTKPVTYYAHWTENATPGDDPNPPAGNACTVTFDPNGGAVVLERSVEKGGVIGALPEIVRDGYALDGWYTLAEGGAKISAMTTVDADITYYAHWTESSGGGDDEPTGLNDFMDGGKTYRFCVGVNKTSGYKDVNRNGINTYQAPAVYNLVQWWGDAYKTLKGAYPNGYTAPNAVNMANDGYPFSLSDKATALFRDAMGSAMSSADERATYFPSTEYASSAWCGGATGDAMVRAAGRRIFAELNNGPIGCLVNTSTSRGAVIWGCEYLEDADGKYATVLYITSTRANGDGMENYQLDMISIDGFGTIPGLKNFNTAAGGVITAFYPIVGPAGKQQSGGGNDEPTVKTFVVTFDPDGGSAVNAQSVEEGKSLASISTPIKDGYAFAGWYDSGNGKLTASTTINANVTYTARWTAVVAPDDPDPDDPAPDGRIGVADTEDDPGVFLGGYNYTMCDNYWTARKRAIVGRKQLFILSGAYWCSNCSFVKDDLNDMGSAFSDKFVVYFSNHDSTTCVYFYGGLPQYGAADPRKVDAFTGTLVEGQRFWSKAWRTTGNGIYAQERGHVLSYVQDVVNAGLQKPQLGMPTNLVVRGLPMLAAGNPGKYELYAQFDDGVEMLVDHGVEWSVVEGDGLIADEGAEGYDAGVLTVGSGTVKIKATSTFYFTGSATFSVSCAPVTDIVDIAIETEEVNLEDNPTPTINAVATLRNGQKLRVSGFGTWSAAFKQKVPRNDPDLEENGYYSGANAEIAVDQSGTMSYRKSYERLEVCDQIVTVALTANGITRSKDIKVWGPTKVAPSRWTLLSKPRVTKYGVVRLACTELKYNYGGEIRTTADTYFGSFHAVMKNGTKAQDSSLRGLTLYSGYDTEMTWTVGLSAKKADGVFGFYSPDDPTASPLAQSIQNIAEGEKLTGLAKGEMTEGFLKAYLPDETVGMSFDEKAAFADVDSDGDGFKNWEEYVLGTDPSDPKDAFTLMQGYQHLTAPAGRGDTMQYKVMYQQRAGRKYYIDGKKKWSDAWTEVASVDLANAEEGNVTDFAYPSAGSAAFADECSFFRVRAALSAHVFDHGDSGAPQVVPNMLVAAPDSVIDLSDGSALDLSSFDTDATDPGTVWVKVAPDTAPGTALISAPKSAEKSLKACRPKDGGGKAFEVVVDPGNENRLVLRVTGGAPSVADGQGEVEVVDDEIRVLPEGDASEIAILNPGDRKVVLPPSVSRIMGIDDAGKIRIRATFGDNKSVDLTPIMKFTASDAGFAIALDENAQGMVIDVDGEEIPVRPTLSDDDANPVTLGPDGVSFTVKSIPGLRYQVLASDSPDSAGFTPAGENLEATSTRRELTVPRSGEAKGFYKVRVSR